MEGHFYSIENEGGDWDTRIEESLSKIESDAAPEYERLLAGDRLNDHQRTIMSIFLATMHVRTPAARQDYADVMGRGIQIHAFAHAVSDTQFAKAVEHLEKQHGPMDSRARAELRESILSPGKFKLLLDKNVTLGVFDFIGDIADFLLQMTWTVLVPQHGFFITTDAPVIRNMPGQFRVPGFAERKVQVSFPLSPHHLLMMTWDQEMPSHAEVGKSWTTAHNRLAASLADSYLYSHVNSGVNRVLARTAGSRPRISSSGYGPKQFAPIAVPRRRS